MPIGLQRGDLKMASEQFIRYYYKQKDWWRNLDNIVINYRHMGECNLRFIHMTTPKQQIDRMNWFWMVK